MSRILLLIILFWIVYIVAKRLMARIKSDTSQTKEAPSAENIVACHQCGLHVPENESQLIDSIIYCNNPECKPKKQHEH